MFHPHISRRLEDHPRHAVVFGDWCLEDRPRSCYKLGMPKTIEKWLLFKYVGREFTPLSKPFKTREQAERARLKIPKRQRKTIGIGVIRIKK